MMNIVFIDLVPEMKTVHIIMGAAYIEPVTVMNTVFIESMVVVDYFKCIWIYCENLLYLTYLW